MNNFIKYIKVLNKITSIIKQTYYYKDHLCNRKLIHKEQDLMFNNLFLFTKKIIKNISITSIKPSKINNSIFIDHKIQIHKLSINIKYPNYHKEVSMAKGKMESSHFLNYLPNKHSITKLSILY